MAQTLRFFNRQMLMGDDGSSTTYYSEVFDSMKLSILDVELRVYAANAAATQTVTRLETTTDPTLQDWQDLGTADLKQTGPGAVRISYSAAESPLIYVRARVTLASGTTSVFSLVAQGRESS